MRKSKTSVWSQDTSGQFEKEYGIPILVPEISNILSSADFKLEHVRFSWNTHIPPILYPVLDATSSPSSSGVRTHWLKIRYNYASQNKSWFQILDNVEGLDKC